MHISKLFVVSSIALVTSGCANLNKLQQIPITTYNPSQKIVEKAAQSGRSLSKDEIKSATTLGQSGAVYLWPPYSSAALVDGKGNRCVLVASGAKSIDASSEAALKIGKAIGQIADLNASVKSTLVESFTKLSAADSRAAFADVALFHLCMLDQNGTFKEYEYEKNENGKEVRVDHMFKAKLIMDAYLKTIEAAKQLKE
jgi:hypothetical protein